MPFKFTMVSDVRGFLKGTADVEAALDDVADSLDDLARDTGKNADEAADKLEKEFSDAFKEVKSDAKRASKDLGDDFKRGTKEASEGTDALKENAASNAKEVAASFDGSIEGIVDGFQGLAAEALEGFGPAGIAAGGAIAVGLGAGMAALQDIKDKADEASEEFTDLTEQIIEAGDATKVLADNMTDFLGQTVDTKELWEVWQNAPVTAREAMQKYGLSLNTIQLAIEGNIDAMAEVKAKAKDIETDWGIDTSGSKFVGWVDGRAAGYQKAADYARSSQGQEEAALKKRDEALEQSNEETEKATAANERFADSLRSSVSTELGNVSDNIKKGKFDVNGWIADVEKAKKRVKRIGNFTEEIAVKWTPAQLENFRQLPVEAQDQIATAWKKGGPKQRKAIENTLDDPIKVKPRVTVDPKVTVKKPPASLLETQLQQSLKGANVDKTVTYQSTVEPPNVPSAPTPKNSIVYKTKVNHDGATKGAQDAADKAQSVANRENNKIEFKTKVNDDGLQGAVNRAAAGINPPTIYVNVKARKEVP